MQLIYKLIKILYLLILATSVALAEFKSARESRLANEIIDSIMDGEAEWIEHGEHKFLAIYTEAVVAEKAVAKGSLLILHGRGFHPNWQDFVYPVRTQLAEQGWNTLAIQMPVLEKNSSYYDYYPIFPEAAERIDLALEYLRSRYQGKIIIIAHSCGFHMANFWLSRNHNSQIDAFIGVSMGPTDAGQQMRQPFFLRKLRNIPILDVYAEFDYPKAIKFADRRQRQFTNQYSVQKIVADAKHYYTDKGDEVVKLIADWLNGLP